MQKEIFINKIYKVIFSIFTIFLGALFILFAFSIYFGGKEVGNTNPYTQEIVSKYLNYLIVPFVLWVLMIIGSYFLNYFIPVKEKNNLVVEKKVTYNLLKKRIPDYDKNYSELYILINKERRNRRIGFIVTTIVCLIFMIVSAIYLFDFDENLSQANNREAVLLAFHIMPFVIGAFIIIITYLYYQEHSIKKEIGYIREILKTYKGQSKKNQKKNYNRTVLITRIFVACLCLTFIIVGVVNQGYVGVLSKAVKLCQECVGIA